MISRANEKIEYELDLVNFLRHTLMSRIQHNITFSKIERHFLKHQSGQFILNAPHTQNETHSSSDSDTFDPMKLEVNVDSVVSKRLNTSITPEVPPDTRKEIG